MRRKGLIVILLAFLSYTSAWAAGGSFSYNVTTKSDVDTNIPAGSKAGKFDVAVVIGNKNYTAGHVPKVDFADSDARSMKSYLLKTFGYDPGNVIYVEDATLATFNEIFGADGGIKGSKLYNYVKPGESRVFVYYVGHGAPDIGTHEAYFVPVDANPHYITANGYKLKTFYKNLSELPAKSITVVLDSCFSGNSEKGLLFQNISPGMLKVEKVETPKNILLMTSASMDQVSTWHREQGHSLFTYYFLKGIQGEADKKKDGRITVAEMKSYLTENVPYWSRRLNSVEQMPVIVGADEDVLVTIKK
jgi:hypothetical protein